MAGTSYTILKLTADPPNGERVWVELATLEGAPEALVRALVRVHGGGVYWPVPARTRQIKAAVVTPEPIVKLGEIETESEPEFVPNGPVGADVPLPEVEGAPA